MHYREFLIRARLEDDVVQEWVSAGWIVPEDTAGQAEFTDVDIARARLILDLKGDIGVNDEGVSVVLHLLDQLHGIRRTLGDILSAVHTAPDDLREQLRAQLAALAAQSDRNPPR